MNSTDIIMDERVIETSARKPPVHFLIMKTSHVTIVNNLTKWSIQATSFRPLPFHANYIGRLRKSGGQKNPFNFITN